MVWNQEELTTYPTEAKYATAVFYIWGKILTLRLVKLPFYEIGNPKKCVPRTSSQNSLYEEDIVIEDDFWRISRKT